MDEKELKVCEIPCYVRAAVDVDTRVVLAVWVSQGRSGLEALGFLRRVLGDARESPWCTWTAPWYP